MTQETANLLKQAFDAQQQDHGMTYKRTKEDNTEETVTIYGSKSTPFHYTGQLPAGITELGRTDAWDFGPGEPYLFFDEPIDAEQMKTVISEIFGESVEIEPNHWLYGPFLTKIWFETPRDHDVKEKSTGHKIFVFWPEFPNPGCGGQGRINYYTDTGPDDEENNKKIIETIARYLELKNSAIKQINS